MSFESFIGLFFAMAMVAVLPGPAVVAITTASLTGGFKRGLAMTMGLVMADYVFILLAVSGLTIIAEALGPAFTALKYACAAYLIWLGISLWRSGPNVDSSLPKHYGSDIVSGLLLTLSNPKAILFYVALFPAFVDIATITTSDLIAILLCATLAFGSVNLLYAHFASMAGDKLKHSAKLGVLQKFAAVIMASAGFSVAAKA
jgi:threonine/homoserine/homoserine lactone efflux protein